MNIWDILEIEETKNVSEIKKAYAKKLKHCKPEVNPEKFVELRQAYELAEQHALGKPIIAEQGQDSYDMNPDEVARHLTITLLKDGNETAIDQFNNLIKNPNYSNIEFSAVFERSLAIYLLRVYREHHLFILHVAETFNWQEKIKKIDDFFQVIAIENLLNQINYIYYWEHLLRLARIPNAQQAKQQSLNWTECCAIKILLSPPDKKKFLKIYHFNKNLAETTAQLANHAKINFPETLAMGFNLETLSWWLPIKIKQTTKKKLPIKLIIFVLYICIVLANHVYENNRQPSYPSVPVLAEASSVSQPTDSKPYAISKINAYDNYLEKPKPKYPLEKKKQTLSFKQYTEDYLRSKWSIH